jgi:hypothetical protein
MKRLFTIFSLVLILAWPLSAFAAFGTVSKAISAQNTFSDAVTVNGMAIWGVYGTFTATVVLQVQAPDGTWHDTGDILTAPGALYVPQGAGVVFRVGVHTGAYTNGPVNVWIRSN